MNEYPSDRSPPLMLVMPCFNEAACLPLAFQQLRVRLEPLFGEIGNDWGLLLIDDGSTDETWSIGLLCFDSSGTSDRISLGR